MKHSDLVKLTRRALGETQVQFGARFDVHAMTVSKWERGERAPGRKTRAKIRELRAGVK
jgi:DNA-binding transcriptional regulator YiaG